MRAGAPPGHVQHLIVQHRPAGERYLTGSVRRKHEKGIRVRPQAQTEEALYPKFQKTTGLSSIILFSSSRCESLKSPSAIETYKQNDLVQIDHII